MKKGRPDPRHKRYTKFIINMNGKNLYYYHERSSRAITCVGPKKAKKFYTEMAVIMEIRMLKALYGNKYPNMKKIKL